ncbi:MAG: dTMP kinase [Acidimicrobiaceae bacterium]
MLIAFEGGEGSGKSTQAGILAERLGAVLTHEPGATRLGARVREVVLDPNSEIDPRAEALLLAADRAQHLAEVIGPALAKGRDVVTDRYLYSSIAYQAFGRGLELQSVRSLSAFAGAPDADLVVLITVSPETRAQRLKAAADRIEASGDEFHHRVELGFKAMADGDPHRWAVIDGDGTVDEVAARVWEAVASRNPTQTSTDS